MTNAFVFRAASSAVLAGLVTALLAAAPVDGRTVAKAGTPQVQEAAQSNPVPTSPNKWIKRPSSELVLPVDERTGSPMWNGRLWVKFRDDMKVRADRGPGQFAACADGRQLPEVVNVLRNHGATMRQGINRSTADLKALEDRAMAKSGKLQPDLASMMLIDVAPGALVEVARKFNDMPIVEWVQFDRILVPDGGGQNMSPQYGCGQNGLGDDAGANNCYTTGMAGRCSQNGGGNGCNNVGACNTDPIPVPCQFGCNNVACCELISDILPGCSDAAQAQGWDALCATYANIYCNGNVYSGGAPIAGGMTAPLPTYRFDPCFALRGPVDITQTVIALQGDIIDLTAAGPGGLGITPTVTTQLMTYTLSPDGTVDPTTLNFVVYPTVQPSDEADAAVASQALPDPSLEGVQTAVSAGCFVDHGFGGCNQTACCVFVCRNDPNCCTVEWDAACVTRAQNATSILNAPCTAPTLPPAIFVPGLVPSPLMTAGPETTGRTRGYQAYTQGPPLLGASDLLPTGIGPSSDNVFPPSVRNDIPGPGVRSDPTTNVGTLQFLVGGFRGGGYDLDGMEALAAQVGIGPQDVRGKGVTAAVIEFCAYTNHEDLINRVIPEPGQTMILISEDPIDPNHGTACLGIIGAEANNFGVTGIAEECQLRFYPIVSREEGSRLANAITNALIDLQEGDLINMSIGAGGGVTIPGQQFAYDLVSVGTSIGVTSICSAGNDGLPVVTVPQGAPEDPPDSGAVIVGACWPGFQTGLLTDAVSAPGPFPGNNYCRMFFSNFTDQEADRGGIVNISAWGTAMTTTGYGDLFTGVNASADPLQVDKLRTYTAQFNGTSSAAPMITGLSARMQSFAKAYFGAALSPAQLRGTLEGHLAKHAQCGMSYANPFFPGYPEDGSALVGDLLPISAGGQLAAINGFPDARSVLAYIMANTYGGPPVNFTIITGNLVAGNQFSLRSLDGLTLRVSSVKKRAGSGGQGYGPILLYPFTGPTTDIQVTLNSSQAVDNINTMQVVTASAVSSSVPVVELVYLYNKVENRWKAIGWNSLGTAIATAGYTPVGDPRDYALPDGSGSLIYARGYTAGLAPGGYEVRHDLFVIGVNIDLMDAGGGGGGN